MTKLKNKIAATTIVIFFVLSMTASVTLLPTTSAHTPPQDVPTNAYVVCTPGIVGVGQVTTIVCWLDRYSPTTGGLNGQHWDGWLLTITQPDGTNITIGPFTCSSALASDFKTFTPTEVGNYTIVFSWPGEAVVNNPAIYSSADIGDFFEGATSQPTTLVVQQTSTPSWPESPLPTSYWTLPINAQDRTWSTLASNWLEGAQLIGGFQSGTAPTTAHVLWTEPLMATSPSSGSAFPGGIPSDNYPGVQTNVNDYDHPYQPAIIMDGVIYYNAPFSDNTDHYGYYAVDLYTGQQLWFKNGTDTGTNLPYIVTSPGSQSASYGESFPVLTNGQMLHVYNINGQGVDSYLWSEGDGVAASSLTSTGTWYMLDPSTGNVILTLTNVPSGMAAMDQAGDLLIYTYSSTTGNLLCWNSTQAILPCAPVGTGQQCWRPPIGAVINAQADTVWENASTTWGTTLDPLVLQALAKPLSGYTMNVTIPTGLPGIAYIAYDANHEPAGLFGDLITATYTGTTAADTDTINIWYANINEHATAYSPWPTLPSTLNTNLGYTVTMNYNKNITVPLPGLNYTWSIPAINYEANVFFLLCQQTGQQWCYSLTTGNPLWGPTVQLSPMGYYSSGGGSGVQGNVYDGIYIAMNGGNYEGTIYAYNVTNGNLLWTYNASTAPYYYESPYGDNSPLMLGGVCDGMVYVYSSEHNAETPMERSFYLRDINLTDGTLIWKLEDYIDTYGPSLYICEGISISDGYVLSLNQYDDLLYCVGKGPSATTVSAPQSGITRGQSFTITGTILDQSPGSLAVSTKIGYGSNGVACVSDASQEGWMEYLYEQQAEPISANITGSMQPAATGVPVTLTAIDPNGNVINLGTTTNNLNGVYDLPVDTNKLGAGPGTYEIIATFAGTDSYGSSSATSYFTVNAAPSSSAAPTATPTSVADMYFVPMSIGIIVLIIVVAIVLALLMLRKKP